jgi:hypothetical protein
MLVLGIFADMGYSHRDSIWVCWVIWVYRTGHRPARVAKCLDSPGQWVPSLLVFHLFRVYPVVQSRGILDQREIFLNFPGLVSLPEWLNWSLVGWIEQLQKGRKRYSFDFRMLVFNLRKLKLYLYKRKSGELPLQTFFYLGRYGTACLPL